MISLSRIGKQYGRQVLFVDTSFQLNPGEKVGLVGPNGAGKTTLFRMISALNRQVRVLACEPPRLRVSVLTLSPPTSVYVISSLGEPGRVKCCAMRAIWMSALLVGCGAYLEAQGAARPRFEAAMQAFWDATSVGDREDAGRRIVASGASFEKVVRSLKTGRTYGKQQTGRIELSSRITAWCWTMPSRSRQRMTLLDHRRCVRWRM